MVEGLWGEEFDIQDNTQSILKKTKEPKEVKVVSIEKQLKSKKTPLVDKLRLIKKSCS